jgi:hypothetical protein
MAGCVSLGNRKRVDLRLLHAHHLPHFSEELKNLRSVPASLCWGSGIAYVWCCKLDREAIFFISAFRRWLPEPLLLDLVMFLDSCLLSQFYFRFHWRCSAQISHFNFISLCVCVCSSLVQIITHCALHVARYWRSDSEISFFPIFVRSEHHNF